MESSRDDPANQAYLEAKVNTILEPIVTLLMKEKPKSSVSKLKTP
jgi:hypothetical protein